MLRVTVEVVEHDQWVPLDEPAAVHRNQMKNPKEAGAAVVSAAVAPAVVPAAVALAVVPAAVAPGQVLGEKVTQGLGQEVAEGRVRLDRHRRQS